MVTFGGVTQGGYRGDIACTSELIVTVSPGDSQGSAATYDIEWTERQLDPADGEALPISRGYHSACVRESEPGAIVVYGGLHGGEPLDDVVRFDTDAFEWSAVETVGPTPAARWAHSASFIGERMWVVGGGDGSDLLRSGDDFADVHVLDFGVTPPRWASVDVSASRSIPRVMGKCHTATAVGCNIVCLAGSMDFSDELWVLNTSNAMATSPATDPDGDADDETLMTAHAEWLRPSEYGEPNRRRDAYPHDDLHDDPHDDGSASDSAEEWLLGGDEPEGASSGSDESDAEFHDAPSQSTVATATATATNASGDTTTDGAAANANAAAAGLAEVSPEAGPEDPGPGRKKIGALSHTAVGVAGGRLVVFGGYGASRQSLADTWEISLGCAEGGPGLAGKQLVETTAAFRRGRPRGFQDLLAMVSAQRPCHSQFKLQRFAGTGVQSASPNQSQTHLHRELLLPVSRVRRSHKPQCMCGSSQARPGRAF